MIEVNLLPGGRKGGGGDRFSLGSLAGAIKGLRDRGGGGGGVGPSFDGYMGFFAAAAAISIGFMAFSFLSVRGENEELNVQLEAEIQDSIVNAATIQNANRLRARGDSIQQRVAIIQEIDADRYTWPHLLDEIASAVPDYTWLREVIYQSENPLTARVAGRAGSIFAITRFMRRLEASRFLRGVDAVTIQEMPSEEDSADLVFMFELTMIYDPPSLDELESVPLFSDGTTQAQTSGSGG